LEDRLQVLARNLERVQRRIEAACQRAGRPRSAVRLVAVTKYVDAATARLLWQLGVQDLGESRPQELWRKAEAVPQARWHLVGHLQRNKVRRTLPLVHLIHSVDSQRLLECLEAEAPPRGVDVLLEVHLSPEPSKAGFAPEELPDIAARTRSLERVRVQGLMTMAPLTSDRDEVRRTFARLRQLRDQVRQQLGEAGAWPELSMGMTSDFEIAIEEGATLVRIGSALFQGLEA
jgi:pyridoxal phosphate enzyme (YggS family)